MGQLQVFSRVTFFKP